MGYEQPLVGGTHPGTTFPSQTEQGSDGSAQLHETTGPRFAFWVMNRR